MEDLTASVAVLKEQQKAAQDTLNAVDERQRGIQATVIRLDAQHTAMLESLSRIEKSLDELTTATDAAATAVAEHESRLNTLDTGIKWGGGILATLVTYTLAKFFGLH